MNLVSPCESTTLTITPFGPISQLTGDPAFTNQVESLDTASQSFGSDGHTFCGERTYSMTPDSYPLISIDANGLLTVQNDDASLDGTLVTFTITAVLNDYSPGPSAVENFVIYFEMNPTLLSVKSYP